MLLESAEFLFHSFLAPKYLVKLGMVQEVIAIKYRQQRQEKHWQKHRENSKAEILKAVSKLKNKRKALIIGAGLLLEIPLKELSEEFEEVILVDIFFMQEAINEIKLTHRCRFEQIDISSVLKEAYYLWRNYKGDIKSFDNKLRNLLYRKPNHFLLEENLDYVLSCNLLSQLQMPIENFFEAKKVPETQTTKAFINSFHENHVEYLKKFPSHCFKHIITDTEKQVFNKDEKLLEKMSSVDEALLNDFQNTNEWIWDLADFGEIENDYALKLKVNSYTLEPS